MLFRSVEGKGKSGMIARSHVDAPEIDGTVLVNGTSSVGDLIPVRITGAREYDLIGQIV